MRRFWPAGKSRYVVIAGQQVRWEMSEAALEHFIWSLFRVDDE